MWKSINAETFGSLSRRVLWFVINYVNFKLKTTSDCDIFGLSVVAKTIAFVSSWLIVWFWAVNKLRPESYDIFLFSRLHKIFRLVLRNVSHNILHKLKFNSLLFTVSVFRHKTQPCPLPFSSESRSRKRRGKLKKGWGNILARICWLN